MAVDPLVSRHPFREFEADLMVAGDPVAGLVMLRESLAGSLKDKKAHSRRGARPWRRRATDLMEKRDKLAASVKDQTPIHPAWLAHCLNQIKAKDAVVVNELGTSPSRLDLTDAAELHRQRTRGRSRRRHLARRSAPSSRRRSAR